MLVGSNSRRVRNSLLPRFFSLPTTTSILEEIFFLFLKEWASFETKKKDYADFYNVGKFYRKIRLVDGEWIPGRKP